MILTCVAQAANAYVSADIAEREPAMFEPDRVAREEPEPGVSGAMVAAAVPLPERHVVFEPSWSATAAHLVAWARSGDVVLTLGAGDVTLLGPEVLELLEERQVRDDDA